MFEELGLNVARQPDNGANPRPDNRAGWLEGETPDVVEELPRRAALARRMARERSQSAVGPLHAAALQGQARCPPRRTARPTQSADETSIEGCALSEIERAWRARAAAPPPAPRLRPAGPARAARRHARAAAVLEQLSRPRRPPARARGRRRGRDALGRRRRRLATGLGHDDDPPTPRGAPRRVRGQRGVRAVRLGLPRQPRRDRRARGRGRHGLLRRAQPRLDHRRLPAVARARWSSTATSTPSTSRGACRATAARGGG